MPTEKVGGSTGCNRGAPRPTEVDHHEATRIGSPRRAYSTATDPQSPVAGSPSRSLVFRRTIFAGLAVAAFLGLMDLAAYAADHAPTPLVLALGSVGIGVVFWRLFEREDTR